MEKQSILDLIMFKRVREEEAFYGLRSEVGLAAEDPDPGGSTGSRSLEVNGP